MRATTALATTLVTAMAALAWSCGAVAADSPVASPKQVMEHHIAVVKKDDVAAIMEDYAKDCVLVTPTATLIGTQSIREFFVHLAGEHRDWKTYNVTQEVKAEGVVLQKQVTSGKVEVFVVRHGKIVFQTLPG
ncbi:MAG TPA: nuclear transport factor 2 family protein [Steroidobacteraceae bacterium]|jgi:hypothetical protein